MVTPRTTDGKIEPDYSFRFTFEDIKNTYGSAEGAFAAGDFMLAAQIADGDSELKACALILAGLLERGIELLESQRSLSIRSRLCLAYALWSLDRDAEAKTILGAAEVQGDPSVNRFAALLNRNRITVFVTAAMPVIFPELQSANDKAAAFQCGPVTVKYVGTQRVENAYDYHSAEPFDTFIDRLPAAERPDLIFALTPQWVTPNNLHKVSVPKVIWCHDTDLFLYRCVENFESYDVGICSSSQEHFEFSRGTGVFTAANIILHPQNTVFREATVPKCEKDIDVLFTGASLATFHAEKPRFIYQLAELSERYRITVVDGHLPESDYFALLARAKFLPVVGRHAGAPSPRWRDALTGGCFVLYPEGTFYDQVAPGCFPFRVGSIADDVARHIGEVDAANDPAYDLAKAVPEINRRFSIHRQSGEKSFERLLKYALFMALIWPRDRSAKVSRPTRTLWPAPGIDWTFFGHENTRDKICAYAKNREAGLSDADDYNNAAYLFAQMVSIFRDDSRRAEWATTADRYFAEGIARFPKSLLLRFNDAHWRFFRPGGDVSAAAEKFDRIIRDFDTLEFNSRGANIGFFATLLSEDAVFPYNEYFDIATQQLVLDRTPQLASRKTVAHRPRDVLLAACHGFIGWAEIRQKKIPEGMARLERALEIFPNLPMAKLYFEILLEQYMQKKRFSREDADKLAVAFVRVANFYPTILLTHIDPVVHILALGGRQNIARNLAAAWYRLDNVVLQLRPESSPLRSPAKLSALYHYRNLLPTVLISRIDSCRSGACKIENLSQLEQSMVAAAVAYDRAPSLRKIDLKKRIADIGVVYGNRVDRFSLKLIGRAFFVWAQLPYSLKRLYVFRALGMGRHGELGKMIFRVQQWGMESIWAKQHWNS